MADEAGQKSVCALHSHWSLVRSRPKLEEEEEEEDARMKVPSIRVAGAGAY